MIFRPHLCRASLRIASLTLAAFLCLVSHSTANAQMQTVANTVMERFAQPQEKACNFDLLLKGMDAAWYNTAEGEDYHYTQRVVDTLLKPDGTISACTSVESEALGQQLLLLYRVTQDAKYFHAATLVRNQIQEHPEATSSPERLAFIAPFEAEYAAIFHDSAAFKKITQQLTQMPQHEAWSMTALVDTLPYYPKENPDRATLLAALRRSAGNAMQEGNASEKYLHIYATQKGTRLGYLPQSDAKSIAYKWMQAQSQFNPNTSDPQLTGAYLLADSEMELAPTATLAHGKTILLDAWFNSQQRQNAAGQKEIFHYKWNDYADSGYSLLGHIFQSYGATLDTLYEAPTVQQLSKAQVYIIVSPDILSKNPNPHYVQPKDANQVAAWVKQGGTLLMLENDPPNADIDHLNLIADRFGIHFNNVLAHHIIGDAFAPGFIAVNGSGPIFHQSHTLYMKDTCTLSLKSPVKSLLTDKSGAVIAMAKYGKGNVVAVIDPWLYNEYTDHRKVHPPQENFAAGKEFVLWLLQQAEPRTH